MPLSWAGIEVAEWPVTRQHGAAMINVRELTKRYGQTTAVDHLSLSVGAGEIFGFLGPNGAGKTTTIRMMMGLLLPSGGTVELGGYDLHAEPLRAKALLH